MTFLVACGVGVLLMWGIVEGFGRAIDTVGHAVRRVRAWWRRRQRKGVTGYVDVGRVHRETWGGVDRLSARARTHTASVGRGRPRLVERTHPVSTDAGRTYTDSLGELASSTRGVSPYAVVTGDRLHDRVAGYGHGTVLEAPFGDQASRVKGWWFR